MPFVSRKLQIAYFPIPKNCGTSVRHALYKIEHGVDFQPTVRDGRLLELWMRYPAVPFDKVSAQKLSGMQKIIVVRDPAERLISAYRNRIHHYGEVQESDFVSLGIPGSIPRSPDFDTFCRYLGYYRRIGNILHHTEPQSVFIGNDLNYFDRVFEFEKLDKMEAYLSELSGTSVSLPRLRADGKPRSEISVSDESYERIASYYKTDYSLLNSLYSIRQA